MGFRLGRKVVSCRRVLSLALSVILPLVLSSGCGLSNDDGLATGNSKSAQVSSRLYRLPSNLGRVNLPPAPTLVERGKIVAQQPFSGSDLLQNFSTTLVGYQSTAGYVPGNLSGSFGTQVSAVVVAPNGPAPQGGYPIMVVAHGTTGTKPACGPSVEPNLRGVDAEAARFAAAGYVVVVPDYQGLGTFIKHPQLHPYLEPKSAAYNVIDGVRAARNLIPGTGINWGVTGLSQGGAASWAAAEYAESYGEGLNNVGAVALNPPADLSPMLKDGVATGYTALQKSFVPLMVSGMAAVYPGLKQQDYLRGNIARDADLVRDCRGDRNANLARLLTEVNPGELTIASASAATFAKNILEDFSLPQKRSRAPIFIGLGTEDQLIETVWTQGAIQKACALGEKIEVREQRTDHTGLNFADEIAAWFRERFGGVIAKSTCPR